MSASIPNVRAMIDTAVADALPSARVYDRAPAPVGVDAKKTYIKEGRLFTAWIESLVPFLADAVGGTELWEGSCTVRISRGIERGKETETQNQTEEDAFAVLTALVDALPQIKPGATMGNVAATVLAGVEVYQVDILFDLYTLCAD